MSVSKFIQPFLALSLLATSSFATTINITLPWGGTDGGLGTGLSYTPQYSEDTKYFNAYVGHSKNGEQRVYFADAYAARSQNCTYESRIPDSTTIIIDNQAVKMSRWCKKFADANKYYYEYTPETTRGHNYVVNLLKTSTSPVKIQLNNDTLYLPVMGFTKIWNSAGGNAI